MRVGLYDHPAFRAHDSGPDHPERPARLDALVSGLTGSGLLSRLKPIEPRRATDAELLRVHTPEHLRRVADTAGHTVRFDEDTQAGPRTYEAALLAAGAAVDAVERVLSSRLDRALCLVRPPGHHAEADRPMGFCYFNNVAVAAAAALAAGLTRVLIIDFDVHHGNGTQHIFESEKRVLFISSHAFPFYPGTGALSEMGKGDGIGFTVNLPLPQGAGDAEYAAVYRDVVEPVGRAFDPQLVIVSAGFDAFGGDPLAGMRLTAEGYGALMDACLGTAAGDAHHRLVVVLEGGYNLDGLSQCGAVVAGRLLGDTPAAPTSAAPAAEWMPQLLQLYRSVHAAHWPVLGL